MRNAFARCYTASSMNLLLWGLTLGTIGKLILGVAVMRVHMRILEEHQIDMIVLKAIKREHLVTFVGIAFILLGYILEVVFYGGYTEFFECVGSTCTGIINAAFQI